MTHYDVFNGDADGICALHQLRLADPRDTTLVTGVKRDIDLLRQVDADEGDTVTVLDVSMEKNSAPLLALLDQGIEITYFDHHFPGDIPDHPKLKATIDTDGNVCTGLLVNRHLKNAFMGWAVTAAFGDNLYDAAREAALPLNLGEEQLSKLQTLGTLLNYNGYGSTIEDLHFPPDALYQKIKPYKDPLDFIENDKAFETLQNGYDSDMLAAAETNAAFENDHCAMFIFPEAPFARRVSGVYSNLLARENPERAHALLSTLPDGAYLISVRAPLATKEGADDLCRQFPTGGGRKAAAGINHLPAEDLERFFDAMKMQFGNQKC